jgi:acyl-CoA synthetase (AMP-forming)/AMP-acid ligase II
VGGIGQVAAFNPDAAAILTMGGPLSFADLNLRQSRLAGAFKNAGLATGDRVAVLSRNRPEYLEVTIAALRAAIVPVPLNPLLTPREIEYILEDSGARWLFTDQNVEGSLELDRIITFGDAYERCLFEAEPVTLSSVALGRPMHYTSGTTGWPKGVWVSPYGPDQGEEVSERFRALWNLRTEDRHLVVSPLAHSAPHRFALRTLEAGGMVVLQPKFDAREVVAAIELFGITSAFMVPTHLERILDLRARHDLSSMRLLAHAGAPIRERTKRQAIDLFPTGSLWEFYGSTEGQATRISTEEWLAKPGSVGKALPGGRLIVVDPETGEEREPNETGEVWVRDPSGEEFTYWGDAARTDGARRNDMFTVGDLGYLDDDGYLFLTGRRHDTIITGGVNVYPQEVERVLHENEAIGDVVVYGVPHDEWGQEVHAAVVPAPEAVLDADTLQSWARERLAGFKCPRHFHVVDELERTATGKLKRVAPPGASS